MHGVKIAHTDLSLRRRQVAVENELSSVIAHEVRKDLQHVVDELVFVPDGGEFSLGSQLGPRAHISLAQAFKPFVSVSLALLRFGFRLFDFGRNDCLRLGCAVGGLGGGDFARQQGLALEWHVVLA